MKARLITTAILISSALPAIAQQYPDDAVGNIPEPSTLALFAAAGIAIAVMAKLKK